MKILISGASKGLGKGLATFLSGKGIEIVSFARNDLDTKNPLWKHYAGIDITKPEQLNTLTEELSDCFGLINNVGIAYDGILATQGTESIQNMVNVNLTSTLILTKMWLRERLRKRQNGSCVTISSIISKRGFSGLSVYSATKGALNSMTLSLAREMGPKGFRFNGVLPGYFESDLSKSLSAEKKNQIIRRTPLNRLATVEDICPLVSFLLSEEAKFITGQLISIDGGLTA